MTASLARMEKGKPSGVGRCLLATDDLPLRQPRRISNLFQFPGDAARVAAVSPRRETCGGVLHPTGGRCRIFFPVTNRNELAGNSIGDGSESDPVIGVFHPQKMEQANVPSVASAYVTERE